MPFCLLFTINSLLIYRTLKKPNKISQISSYVAPKKNLIKSKKKMVGLVITILTLGFMITTIPSSVVTGFLFLKLNQSKQGRVAIFVCDILSFLHHSSKFEVLLLYNFQFTQEFKHFINGLFDRGRCIKSNSNNISKSDIPTDSTS